MTKTELEHTIQSHDKAIAEIWDLFRKVSEQMAETDKRIDKVTDSFGRLIENFLCPGLQEAFEKRNIHIQRTSLRFKANLKGENMEIDVLGIAQEYAVIVEAKTTLRVDDVKKHIKKLERFKEFFPEYVNRKLLGVVAGIEFASDSNIFAQNEGLFVVTLGSETIQILNEEKFVPRIW